MRTSIITLAILSSFLHTCCYSFVPKSIASKVIHKSNEISQNNHNNVNTETQITNIFTKVSISLSLLCLFTLQQPVVAHGASLESISRSSFTKVGQRDFDRGSNWERSRQKRTVAIKEMESKGIIKVETDDSGSQILRFPWIPNTKVPYKSLSIQQRLLNEVCAGAFGEFCKDLLLHPVDTLKTRRQAQKKKASADTDSLNSTSTTDGLEIITPDAHTVSVFNPATVLSQFKGLYSGFPIVMTASIPQGGTFFLIKKGLIETISVAVPATPDVIKSMVSIAFSVMGYWTFRTPAEIIKTQVQTGQAPSVKESIETIRQENDGDFKVLWKYFPVMMWLDIPFQVMNFILYGIISEALTQAGFAPSTLTRLVCGVASGMVCAGVTCPVDVCKTRIISRDKENSRRQKLMRESMMTIPESMSSEIYQVINSDNIALDGLAVPSLVSNSTVIGYSVLDTSGSISGSIDTDIEISKKDEKEKNQEKESTSTELNTNMNVPVEMLRIFKEEGLGTLFLGLQPRLLYTGLANGIRLAAYGTSRMDLMMRTLDDI